MRPVVGISVEPARVVACAVRRGRTVWAAEAGYAGTQDLAQVLAALAAERPARARVARVALACGLARLKLVEGLPRLRRADLAAHVQLNSRRYFVQNGVPLVTDAHPEGGASRLAATPAPLVEAIAEGLAAAGLECAAIVPAQALENAEGVETATAVASVRRPALSLLPHTLRQRARDAESRSLYRLAFAAAASLVLAGAAHAGALIRRERAAAAELARLAPTVAGALAVRRDLDAATAALDLLQGAEGSGARPVRVLAAITAALPDSAFLASARFERDGTVRLAGYAKSAARVLERLERIPGLSHGAAEGPVTREVVAGREWERFTIVFRVRQ